MKEIKITSSGIKQAIDDLVNENELLQDKIYKQEDEIKRLNRIIDDVNFRIEQRAKENITDELRIELRNIELISKGIIKVVRDEK